MVKDINIDYLELKGIDTYNIIKKKGWFVNEAYPIFSTCQLLIEEYGEILEELKSIYISGESDIYSYIDYYEKQIELLNKTIYD